MNYVVKLNARSDFITIKSWACFVLKICLHPGYLFKMCSFEIRHCFKTMFILKKNYRLIYFTLFQDNVHS